METDTAALRTYFAKLGLEAEIADIYLALHAEGPQTISSLSRASGIERTRIYRLIDDLMDSGLIEVETHYKRGILKAAPIANLRILISRREQELQSLQDELQLVEQVLGRNQLTSPATRVQMYQGEAGIRQMLWNETKSKTEVLSILFEDIQSKTGSRFFERWVRTCNDAGLQFRSVYGDTFKAGIDDWYTTHTNERLARWQGRQISRADFPLTHGTLIYDDVTAYFNWKDGEVFGIETYNKDIAAAQRQYFEMLWKKAD